MSSRSTLRSFRTVLAAAAMLAIGSTAAQAVTLSSAPLRMLDQQYFSCAVVNVGTKPIAVEIDVTINGGGYGAAADCASLAPNAVCAADNQAGSPNYRFCSIKISNKKSVRGTFCNTTTGICVPVQ